MLRKSGVAASVDQLKNISEQIQESLVDGRITDAMAQMNALNHQIGVVEILAIPSRNRIDL